MNYKLSLLQGMVLLYNLYVTQDKDLDADYLFNELVQKLNSHSFSLPKDVLESLLAYCNYNSEDGVFWHPNEASFDTFVYTVLGDKETIDKFYNLIEPRKSGDENGKA